MSRTKRNPLLLILALAGLVTCNEPTTSRNSGKPADDPGETPVYPMHHEAPAWSPTGLIAYEDRGIVCSDGFQVWRDRALAGLYVLDPRTGEKRRLLSSGSVPAWSRDGTKLAISIDGTIFSLNADGSDLRQLTSSGSNWYPSWSPDGEWIAFDTTLESIHIMRANGSDRQSIGGGKREPCWHPYLPLIVHIGFPSDECGGSDLYVMDGRQGWLYGTRMTRIGFEDGTPDYSPDGLRIASFSYRAAECDSPPPGEDLKSHIWIMNADGTEARQLTRNPGLHPSWSPDGSKIVYARQDWNINTPENGVLWIVDVASGEESQLTFKWPQRCSTAVSDISWSDLKRHFR